MLNLPPRLDKQQLSFLIQKIVHGIYVLISWKLQHPLLRQPVGVGNLNLVSVGWGISTIIVQSFQPNTCLGNQSFKVKSLLLPANCLEKKLTS